jgi:hypothetical protein
LREDLRGKRHRSRRKKPPVTATNNSETG